MRFKQFLYEANSTPIVDFLRKNCREACEDAVKSGKFLWRGMTVQDDMSFSAPDKDYIVLGNVVKVRKDRIPRDTPVWAHNAIDDFFEEQFGKRLRSTSAFCFNQKEVALAYGTPHIILPFGDYDIFFSDKIGDLTMDIFPDLNPGDGTGLVGGDEYWKKQKIELSDVTREMELWLMNEFLKQAGYETGPGPKALKRGVGELMVQCERYLAIPMSKTIAYNYNENDVTQWIYEATE